MNDPAEKTALAALLGPPIEMSPTTLTTFPTVVAVDDDEEDAYDYASDDM